MKITELQIGDWVSCSITNKYHKVSSLTSDVELEGERFIFNCLCDNIEPIPLTAEILENNGFFEFCKNNWSVVINDALIELRRPDEKMEIWLNWEKNNDGTYADYLLPYPNTVHKLQHALMLCDIEKEIEL